jgi:hypothetical protein
LRDIPGMSTATPRGISLRADYGARDREWRADFVRSATISVLARMRKTSADEIRAEFEKAAKLEQRSPVQPARVGDFPGGSVAKLMILADSTALSEILDAAIKIDLTGVSSFKLVTPSNFSQAVFVEEGFPIPAATGLFSGIAVELPKKLAMLAPISSEMETYSAPVASIAISQLLRITVNNGALAVMFGTDPATPAAPAGLLHNVAPLAAGASPGEDIRALLGAISAAGISTRSVFFVVAAGLSAVLETQNWPLFKRKVIEAPTLPAGMIVAIAGDGFVVGADGSPVIDTSRSGLLHLADPAAPLVGTDGTDGTAAGPMISMYQVDSFSLRCICRVSWACASGAVAWIENATW